MNKKMLITGGNGFIGHHVCEHFLKHSEYDIDIMDKMTYASMGFDRLKDIQCYDSRRVRHFSCDFTHPIESHLLKELSDVSFILHLGAETHVDNSITDPEPFVMSNVVGTFHILQFARKCEKLEKMIYFSTDEIFGPADAEKVPDGFKEWDRYNSTNPYSATKAGGEELCLAFANTYKTPIIITHTMNVFGERQHPEKFIPMTIRNIRDEKEVIIHSDPSLKKPGSRYWIHARNVAAAMSFLLEHGKIREKYNIVGEREVNVLEMARFIAKTMNKELRHRAVDFHSSRPGHDLRYALDGSKLKEMGFEYPKNFEESLSKTVYWLLASPRWLEESK